MLSLTNTEKLQYIIDKSTRWIISDEEKGFIFSYLRTSPEQVQGGETLDRFAKNLIIVINSFFEYGFQQKGQLSAVEVSHYWELISYYFNTYSSVAYVDQ